MSGVKEREEESLNILRFAACIPRCVEALFLEWMEGMGRAGQGGYQEPWLDCVKSELLSRHPCGDANQPGAPGGLDLGDVGS